MGKENDMNIGDINLQNIVNPNSYTNTDAAPTHTEEQQRYVDEFGGRTFSDDGKFIVDIQGRQLAEKDASGKYVKIGTAKPSEDKSAGDKPADKPVDKTTEEEEVVEYKADKDGNLLDSTGKIVYKKGEYKVNTDGTIELPSEEDVDMIRKTLIDEYGVQLTDGTGQPKSYPNTKDGIAAMVYDAATVMKRQAEEDTFRQYPQAKAFLNHLAAGNDEASFFNIPTTFRDIKIPAETEDNKDTLKTVYKDLIFAKFRQQNNYNNLTAAEKALVDKEAQNYYNYQVQTGTDRDSAITAQKLLAAAEKQEEAQRDLRNQQIIEKQEAIDRAYWDNIKDTVVTKGVVGNIKIPATEREAFFNYMNKPVNKNGDTQEILDAIAESEDARTLNLQLAYMRFLKFDIDKLVTQRAAEKQINELKIGSKKKTVKIAGSLPIDKPSSTDISDITIDNIRKAEQK